MSRKAIFYILASVIIIFISLIFIYKANRASLILKNMNQEFSKLSSFQADVHSTVDGEKTTSTLLYKSLSKYKMISQDGAWSIFDGLGVFFHYDKGRTGVLKIDSSRLSPKEKIKFYSQIPPFPGIFLARMDKENVNFVGEETDGQRKLLHFKTTDITLKSADFWVDSETGIVMKYTDTTGTEWSVGNIKLNVAIPFDEFYYLSASNMEIIDITDTFSK